MVKYTALAVLAALGFVSNADAFGGRCGGRSGCYQGGCGQSYGYYQGGCSQGGCGQSYAYQGCYQGGCGQNCYQGTCHPVANAVGATLRAPFVAANRLLHPRCYTNGNCNGCAGGVCQPQQNVYIAPVIQPVPVVPAPVKVIEAPSHK